MFQKITIRQAEERDADAIWHLLHAASKVWSTEGIIQTMPQFLVLTRNDQLLGVLHKNLTPHRPELPWVVIHPLYSEELLQNGMIQLVKGTRDIR